MMPQYIHFLGADSQVLEAKLPLCFITIQATFCMNHALYAYIPDGVEDLFEQFPHQPFWRGKNHIILLLR